MQLALALLLGAVQLSSAVPNQLTKRLSDLGTLDAPYLPHILSDGLDKRQKCPDEWLTPEGSAPNTGKTRFYDWTVTRQEGAPDGVKKGLILVNGQFPGPTIEANWGDTIKVKVTNKLENPGEGTTLHWHGFLQTETPWADGLPGVSQCPIAPGDSFTYEFRATQYGTSWWHSHYNAQYMDGAFGAIVVHGPTQSHYDVDVGPVILHDWSHEEYYRHLTTIYLQPPFALPTDTNLINGRMPYNCTVAHGATVCHDQAPTDISKFKFQDGKVHRLRLINAGRQGNEKFSIDDHELEVIANDFVPVKPYKTKVVTLAVGQRTDVLVRGKKNPRASYWMRADLDPACLNTTTFQPNAHAAIYYPSADTDSLPAHSNPTPWKSNACNNDPLTMTQALHAPPISDPDKTMKISLTIQANSTGNLLFYVNDVSGVVDFSHPVRMDAANGETDFSEQRNVYNLGNAKSVRAVIYNHNPYQHPMHLHGHNFHVLASGYGEWDGTIVNPEQTQMRDTHVMSPGGDCGKVNCRNPSYMVLQWDSVNPGVWPLHCHMLIHSSPGLMLNYLEQPDKFTGTKIPAQVKRTCKNWDKWSKDHAIEQPGSGWRKLLAFLRL